MIAIDSDGDKRKCYGCNTVLIWDSDFGGEDAGLDSNLIVSYFHCPNCNSEYRIAVPIISI